MFKFQLQPAQLVVAVVTAVTAIGAYKAWKSHSNSMVLKSLDSSRYFRLLDSEKSSVMMDFPAVSTVTFYEGDATQVAVFFNWKSCSGVVREIWIILVDA